MPPARLDGRDARKRRRPGGATAPATARSARKQQKFGGPKGDTNSQPNLKIDKPCWIDTAGTYVYGNINIIGPNGSLEFRDPAAKGSQVNFWAKNIIVENGGTLKAGTATAPYGSRGGVLTIYLYGADQTKGLDPNVGSWSGARGPLPDRHERRAWGRALRHPDQEDRRPGYRWRLEQQRSNSRQDRPGYPANDYFYQYGPLPGDMRCTDPNAKPNDPPPRCSGRSTMELGPAPIRNSKPAISATRSWPCPMAAPFSSSATRARRCPRRRPRRRHADFGSSAIRGHSTPRAQWVRRPNSPARALRGRGHREVSSSSGSMVISATAAGATAAGGTIPAPHPPLRLRRHPVAAGAAAAVWVVRRVHALPT